MVQNVGEGVIPKAIQTITMAQRRGRRPASPVGVGTPPRRQSAVPGQKNGDLPAKMRIDGKSMDHKPWRQEST